MDEMEGPVDNEKENEILALKRAFDIEIERLERENENLYERIAELEKWKTNLQESKTNQTEPEAENEEVDQERTVLLEVPEPEPEPKPEQPPHRKRMFF